MVLAEILILARAIVPMIIIQEAMENPNPIVSFKFNFNISKTLLVIYTSTVVLSEMICWNHE